MYYKYLKKSQIITIGCEHFNLYYNVNTDKISIDNKLILTK